MSLSLQHKGSRPLLSHDSDDREDEEEVNDFEPEVKVHKYVIQAQVLRDSWPLSKSAWEFIAMLKNLDRLDVEGKCSTSQKPRQKYNTTQYEELGFVAYYQFFILCDVIVLVRLPEKFEIDHSWE